MLATPGPVSWSDQPAVCGADRPARAYRASLAVRRLSMPLALSENASRTRPTSVPAALTPFPSERGARGGLPGGTERDPLQVVRRSGNGDRLTPGHAVRGAAEVEAVEQDIGAVPVGDLAD